VGGLGVGVKTAACVLCAAIVPATAVAIESLLAEPHAPRINAITIAEAVHLKRETSILILSINEDMLISQTR
jgi:hypothetical protein